MTEKEVYRLALNHASDIAPKYGADPIAMARHLTGIASVESRFDPKAKNSGSTARGLMQILICTQREIENKRAKIPFAPAMFDCSYYKHQQPPMVSRELDKVFNPDYAMMLASYELGYQYKRYGGDWKKAVHAYNQGSYKASGKEGNNYASKVTDRMPKDANVQEYAAYEVLPRREFY